MFIVGWLLSYIMIVLVLVIVYLVLFEWPFRALDWLIRFFYRRRK